MSTERTAQPLRALAALACTLAACALAACTGHLNQSNGLDGTGAGSLPALQANVQSSLTDPSPSLQGLDRHNWALVMVPVPRGQVQVQPTYSEDPTLVHGTARVDGAYPTRWSVLQGPSDPGQLAVEGIVQPLWPSVLFVAAPVRMVSGEVPGTVRQEPRAGFQLVPCTAAGVPIWDSGN